METEVVVVTGADNGIGFHLVTSLIELGFRVAAIDLFSDNLASVADSSGNGLRPYLCDVADRHRVEQTIAKVIQEWGRVDILVNNAALAIFRRFEEKSLDETRKEFEVNYFGYVSGALRVGAPPAHLAMSPLWWKMRGRSFRSCQRVGHSIT